MQSMLNPNYLHWLVAIILGSLINLSLFVFLPNLGRTEKPKQPQVIELDFLAWQPPVDKKTPKTEKIVKKPKKKKKPKPKKKPKKIKPLVKPKPKPVLSEAVVPEKVKPLPSPPEIIEEIEEFVEPERQTSSSAESTSNALPTPTPIFKLTSFAQMIHRETPVYPPDMKAQGKEAVVKLKVLIDTKGKVRQVTVKKSGGYQFDLAAIEAIKNSTFTPAKVEGRSVSVLMLIPVKFKLR